MHHIKGLDNCLADALSRLPITPRITTRRDPEDPRILSMEAASAEALPEDPSTGPLSMEAASAEALPEEPSTGPRLHPPRIFNDSESFPLRHPKKGGMSHM